MDGHQQFPLPKEELHTISPNEHHMDITETNASSNKNTRNSDESLCSKSPKRVLMSMLAELPIAENCDRETPVIPDVGPKNKVSDSDAKYCNDQDDSIKQFTEKPLNPDPSVLSSNCAVQRMEVRNASTCNCLIKKNLDSVEYDDNRSAPKSQKLTERDRYVNYSNKGKRCSRGGCTVTTVKTKANDNSDIKKHSVIKNVSLKRSKSKISHDFRQKEQTAVVGTIQIWVNCKRHGSVDQGILRKMLKKFLKRPGYQYDIRRLLKTLTSRIWNPATEMNIYPCLRGSPIPMQTTPCDCCPRTRMDDRLRSFQWIPYFPPDLNIRDLAFFGFYYCRNQCIIQCCYCGIVPADCRSRDFIHLPHCRAYGTYLVDGGNPDAPVMETENQESQENYGRNRVTSQIHNIQTTTGTGETTGGGTVANLQRTGCFGAEDLAALLRLTIVDTPENNQQRRQNSIVLPSNALINRMDYTNNASNHRENVVHILHRRFRSSALGSQLQQDDTRLRNQHICMICGEREIRVVFLPCGHPITCIECSTVVDVCPEYSCQCHIQERIRIASLR